MKKSFPKFKDFHKNHLGFWGTIKLVYDLHSQDPYKRRLVLLSEFGEELMHERLTVVQEINILAQQYEGNKEQTNWNIDILASDIGTRVDFNLSKILCQYEGILCKKEAEISEPFELIRGPINPHDPHQPITDIEIQYLCKTHRALQEFIKNHVD